MRRGIVQSEGNIQREPVHQSDRRKNDDGDDHDVDRSPRPYLDLLNLRSSLSVERKSWEAGDNPDNQNVNIPPRGHSQSRDQLYNRLSSYGNASLQYPTYKKCNQFTKSEDLFLLPPNKKNSCEAIKSNGHLASETETGQTFPFRSTPSGNLKIKTRQVVYESKKLSVLVADPERTRINFVTTANPNERKVPYGSGEFTKNSAMDAILSQAGISVGLGSIIGETPVRIQNKVASEYESKQTSEILDPELNLCRLGYSGSDPIDWSKVTLPDKKDLYLELCRRITNKKNADCKVHIGREEFSCHLIVLQCYSELFDSYIAIKKVEIPADKCSATSFAFIYDWMVSEEQSYKYLNRENVLDIFNSAKYLKIKDLVEQCWAFVDNADVFTEDTAFLLYVDAKAKNLEEVRELMIPRIQDFFLILVSSQDWLELSVEDIKNLLSSNYIRINCEMEVFMSAVRWLKADWSHRERYRYEVLQCVRFGNIAPWQLVDIKRNPENPEFMELARDPAICKLLDDGLAFVIIKYWYGQDNEDFQHWNSVLGLQEPPERHWSGMDKTYFTYREFLIYLDQYRRNQLIEKSKPRHNIDKKMGAASGTAVMHEEPSHSMEDFLVKKKKTPKYSAAPPEKRQVKNRKLGVSSPNMQTTDRKTTIKPGGKSPYSQPGISSPSTTNAPSNAPWYLAAISNAPSAIPAKTSNRQGPKTSVNSMVQTASGTPTAGSTESHHPTKPSGIKVARTAAPDSRMTSEKDKSFADGPRNPRSRSGSITSQRSSKSAGSLRSRKLESAKPPRRSFLKRLFRSRRSRSQPRTTFAPITKPEKVEPKPQVKPKVPKMPPKKSVPPSTTSDAETGEAIQPKAPPAQRRTSLKNDLREKELMLADRQYQRHDIPDIEMEEELRHTRDMFTNSNQDLARLKLNQLSVSMLGPPGKNYLREGSLFCPRHDTILVFGGIDLHVGLVAGKHFGQNVYRYDAQSNRWELIGTLPEPRHHHCVAFMNGRVYLAGGVDPRHDDLRGKEAVKGNMWSFDPTNRNWFSETSMKVLRKNFGLVVARQKLFAFGGLNNEEVGVASMERYDALKDTWDFMSPMKHARGGLAYTKFRDHIWAVGGIKDLHSRAVLDVAESYNIDRDQWTRLTRLRLARCYCCLFTMSDRLYLIGGAGKNFSMESSSSLGDVDVWDNSLLAWKKINELSIPRHGHSLAYIGPQIFILGGFTTYYMRTLTNSECYCTKRGAWIKGIANLPTPLSGHTSVTLPPAYLVSGKTHPDIVTAK